MLSASTEKTRSDGQKAALLEKRGVLLHKIEKWRRLQAVYMPGALDADTSNLGSPRGVKAESIKLWLPSQLDIKDRGLICLGGVINSEKDLRFAQLEDSLNDLRRARRIRHGLATFHKVQLAGEGQKIQTKSHGVVQTIQDRITKCAQRYCAARKALLHLDPQGDWQHLYLALTEDDNRGPGKEPQEIAGSDGRYTLSWIWRSSTMAISPEEVNEDMRVEWAQCIARAERWEEEAILLQEEMRRVVQFLEWRSVDWFAKADSRMGATPVVRAGLSAYANKQGSIFHNLAVRFSQRWRSALISLSLPHDWAVGFLNTHKEPLNNPDFKKQKKRKKADDPPAPDTRTTSLLPIPASTDVPPLPNAPETISRKAQVSVGTDANSVDPEVDAVGPDVNAVGPDVDAVDLDVDAVDLDVDAVDPDVDAVDPDVDAVDPDTDDVDSDEALSEYDSEYDPTSSEYDSEYDPTSSEYDSEYDSTGSFYE